MNAVRVPADADSRERLLHAGLAVARRAGIKSMTVRAVAAEGDSQWVFYNGNYQEYEADKRRRLGEEGARPKRMRFKPIH